jgi:hypothetical protein
LVARLTSAVFFFAIATRDLDALFPVARRAGGRAFGARAAFGRAAGAAAAATAGRGAAGSRGFSGACVRETSVKRICSPMA